MLLDRVKIPIKLDDHVFTSIIFWCSDDCAADSTLSANQLTSSLTGIVGVCAVGIIGK